MAERGKCKQRFGGGNMTWICKRVAHTWRLEREVGGQFDLEAKRTTFVWTIGLEEVMSAKRTYE